MNNKQLEDTDVYDTVERLQKKYLDKKRQFPQSDDTPNGNQAGQSHFTPQRSKPTREEFKCYSDSLKELFKAVATHSDQSGCDQALQNLDSQLLFTESDVTLPSCVYGSAGSPETETCRESSMLRSSLGSRHSDSFNLANIYQEMMMIYEQLQEERQSQQQWEKELYEKEKRLKQQEQALRRLAGLEEEVQTYLTAQEERRRQQLIQLRIALREKSKENKRLKSSFDSIKELNDSTKKQLTDMSEQKKKLEGQFQRVQARLQNLQGILTEKGNKSSTKHHQDVRRTMFRVQRLFSPAKSRKRLFLEKPMRSPV